MSESEGAPGDVSAAVDGNRGSCFGANTACGQSREDTHQTVDAETGPGRDLLELRRSGGSGQTDRGLCFHRTRSWHSLNVAGCLEVEVCAHIVEFAAQGAACAALDVFSGRGLC